MGGFKVVFLHIATVKCHQKDIRSRVRHQEQYAKERRITCMKEFILHKAKDQHTVNVI